MADSKDPSPSPARGFFSKLLFLGLLAAAAALALAVVFVVLPQDVSDLDGSHPPAKALPKREMKGVLKNALERGYPITLTEVEINQWLARTLVAKQGGLLKDKVTLERVCVRLEEGRAEVIMVRKILGYPFTVSMYLQAARMEGAKETHTEIELHGGPYAKDFPELRQGGRFGKLVVPQGFLILVMPAYKKLATSFSPEIELAFRDMARINIKKGGLLLDPRELLGQQGMPRNF